ncbi:MAG TPA: UDP-glucose/GDP-mannose dehydrogenase family protein [Burkholderiaceae bacterium]|nr:UDP-glucose/GDP-mannose dehydrogenase family protein [Burkholderiaceae bacterium]
MKVSIFGTGYVGLITGACLAHVGNDVSCVDIVQQRIDDLRRGVMPIYEPGLEQMVRANHAARRLDFTTDARFAIERAEILIIAVGTPPDEDGSADLVHVLQVARTIGRCLTREAIVVLKSTVPVGTADRVRQIVQRELAARNRVLAFDVVSNPEFLKEGAAIDDCLRPARIVIGSGNPASIETMRQLYAPFNRNRERIVVMDCRSAELTKYAANAMLAAKISFMNEVANIADRVGADIEMVRRGIGSDPRIGHHFIYAGAGYGGSCFPKDVEALIRMAETHGERARMLQAVEAVNEAQKARLFEMLNAHFGGRLIGTTIALWGLAFKPETDDMREAPSRTLLARLWQAGACIRAHDPAAMEEALRLFGEREDLVLCATPQQALEGSDALVVQTEWKVFWNPDFAKVARTLRTPAIFDGRNLYEPAQVEAAGIAYYGIGRGRQLPRATGQIAAASSLAAPQDEARRLSA